MNRDIFAFLTTGRKFRAARSVGPLLLVERDLWLRELIESWILRQGPTIISCSSFEEAMAFLSDPMSYVEGTPASAAMRSAIAQRPKCVIVELDGRWKDDAADFLRYVDEYSPATISVAVTDDKEYAVRLASKLPRVTFVLKGEGLEDALKGLFPPKGEA